VRLLVFVLKQLDLNPLYEVYNAYCERRRREQADREREAAEQGAGKLIEADEGAARNALEEFGKTGDGKYLVIYCS
jgi:replication-associated recombination protein RarA